jgi:hypothetical protein
MLLLCAALDWVKAKKFTLEPGDNEKITATEGGVVTISLTSGS